MPEPEDTMSLGPWMRGVNFSKPANELRPDELYDGENVEIGNAGQAEKRNGSTPLNSSALNSGVTVTACGNQKFSASSEKTFAIVGDKFYEDIGGTPTDRTNSKQITAGDDNTWDTVNADGTLIGHNGASGDVILKWAASGNIAALDVDSRFTTAKWVEWWDRVAWWGNLSSGANRVWRSDTDDIETYGATNFWTFDDDVTGLRRFSNSVVVHTDISVTMLMPTGNASIPYRRHDIINGSNGEGGTVSGRSVVNVPGIGQCFIRRDGVYAFTGQNQLVKISDKLDGSRFWDNVNKDRLLQSFAQIYPSKQQVWWWIPYGAGQTDMNYAIILNYGRSKTMGEYVWELPVTGLTRNCAGLIDDKPHFGGYDDGYIYTHDTGTADNDGSTDNGIDAWAETAMPPPYGGKVDCEWGDSARIFFEVKGTHGLQVLDISPDIPTKANTIEMGGTYDGIGAFEIGVSAISGDLEISYKDFVIGGGSPFKRYQFRNSAADAAFSVRQFISVFKPKGPVYRNASGVY